MPRCYANPDVVTIGNKEIVAKIREFAKESMTNPSTWAAEAISEYIKEHRSGKYIDNPDRYAERDPVDEYELLADPFAEEEEEV